MQPAAAFLLGLFSACLMSWAVSVFTPRGMYFSSSFNADWSCDTINIVLGNSRSLSAIDCNELSKTTRWAHMGYSSSDISTQILALHHAEAKSSMIDTVLWEISPFSFDDRRVHRHQNFCRELIQSHPPLIAHIQSAYEASSLFPNRSTLPSLRQKMSSGLSGDYSERWHCEHVQFKPLSQETLNNVFPDNRIQFDQEQIQQLDKELQRLTSVGVHVMILFTPSRSDFKSAIVNYDEYKIVVNQLVNKPQVIDLDRTEDDSMFMDADHVACPTTFTRTKILPAIKTPSPEYINNALQQP